MLRKPAVAGTFYPDNPEKLKEIIHDCFTDDAGVGFVPFASIHIIQLQKNITFDEAIIIGQIQSHTKGNMILAPMWIREVISFCSQNQYYKIQQAITASICNGRIKKGLVMYLNQFRRTFING